jgi:hypothetical protein
MVSSTKVQASVEHHDFPGHIGVLEKGDDHVRDVERLGSSSHRGPLAPECLRCRPAGGEWRVDLTLPTGQFRWNVEKLRQLISAIPRDRSERSECE